MKRPVFSLFAVFLLIIFTNPDNIALAGSDQTDYQMHAESSERLINIMRSLFSIVHEGNVDEEKNLSQEQLTNLIETVEELLFYAEIMSTKVPDTELEENQAVIFRAMAGQLYDEALNVQQIANNYDLSTPDSAQNRLLNEAYLRLDRTCAACHQLFRDKTTQ